MQETVDTRQILCYRVDMTTEQPWQDQAACTGASVDFYNLHDPNKSRLKAICASCKVSEACLGYALDTNQEYGMWGGTTPHERRVMREAVEAK